MDGTSQATSDRGQGLFGRDRELDALAACLAEVCTGRGRVVTIAGPAGIGKTRLAQEFAGIAARQGVTVLSSHCHEEPAAPAYWPWTRLLEQYVDRAGESALEALAGDDLFRLAALSPRLAAHASTENGAPPADARSSRFQLFDTVSRYWLAAARRAPLMLMVDDLHWCDTPSLKLLEFLVQDMGDAPLMLVLTYRDDQLDRRHPLSDTLGEIARRTAHHRLVLGGLNFADSARLIRAASGTAHPPPDRIALLHQRSEGNPFFLMELMHYLATGSVAGDESYQRDMLAVPDGVRTIIGKRLNRLSPPCERMLGVAAIVGRAFPVSLVAPLLDSMSEAALWDALDEGRLAHVIEPVPEEADCHRFVHALIRETLYDEMLPARRMQLHHRCGVLLETRYSTAEGAHLSEIAYHFACAAPLGDPARAVELVERAARHATARFAYEETSRLYRLALDLVSVDAPSQDIAARHRCELLVALGDSQARAGEGLEALQTFRKAATLAGELGLVTLAAQAAIGFEEASWRPGLAGDVAVSLLEQARQSLGPPDAHNGALLARVLAALARAHGFCGHGALADRLHAEAIALARSEGDRSALMMALRTGVSDIWRPERTTDRLRAAEEALALADGSDDVLQQTVDVLGWYLFDLFAIGDMAAIEAELAHYRRLVETLREPFYQYVYDTVRAGLAFHQGRFAEFESLANSNHELGSRIQGLEVEGPYGLQMFSLRREQGRLLELAPVIAQFVASTPAAKTWRPGLALIYWEIGETDAARTQFEALAALDFTDVHYDGLRACCLGYLAEVCARLDDKLRAPLLYALLLPHAGHNVVAGAGIVSYGSVERHLGMLAATAGRWQTSVRHFEAAIDSDARTGAVPWLAHARERYAAMLERRGRATDRERARELALAAANAAATLGMPRLERDAHALVERIGLSRHRTHAPDELTQRELGVLRLLAEGASNRGIAERLFISPHTVANHVRSILAKTGASNRTEAVAYATRERLFEKESIRTMRL